MAAKTDHPDALTAMRVFTNLVHDGRGMTLTRIQEAMGIGSSTWERRLKGKPQGSIEGVLDPKLLITAAQHFGLNPVEVLVECGVFSKDTAIEYVDRLRGQMPHPPRARRRRLRDFEVIDDGEGLR